MSSPETNAHLAAILAELAAAEPDFAGLEGYSATVHQAFGGGGNVCVVWTLTASHGAVAVQGGPPPGAQPFLGWYATGRKVRIPVVSLVRAKEPASIGTGKAWHHHWDRLGALAQIGVRAVGRPVLRADNALDR